MEPSGKLDLETLLIAWEKSFHQSQAYTKADIQDLKSHLLEIYDEMLENGLDEEEAFLIASKRLGRPVNWEDEFKQTNQPIIQTRKALLIISGVIFYYFSYYFTGFFAKSIVVLGTVINIEIVNLILINRIILAIPLFSVLFFFTSLIVNDKYLYQVLERKHISPKQAVYIVVFTLIFAIGDRSMLPLIRNAVQSRHFRNILFEMYIYFEYIYLLLIVIGFVIVYKRYFKNLNGTQTN